jgi:shikimate kinase
VRLIFIGLPGSGKSSVGRQVARRLGLTFVDSDQEIERRIGESISSFFAAHGEEAFRDLEQRVIAELAAAEGVIATGGGAVLRPANREVLRSAGTVIYLRSTPEDLLRRVRHDTKRPLLQVADPLARLRELHTQRDPLYCETAHFTVDTGRPSVSTLAGRIVSQLELAGLIPPGP